MLVVGYVPSPENSEWIQPRRSFTRIERPGVGTRQPVAVQPSGPEMESNGK
jgi:hypothetical protein